MPTWGKKKNEEAQPEQKTVGKKVVRSKGKDALVDKLTELEKKIIEKECQTEIQQLKVLKRMRKAPSWNMAVKTLLHCENNPSDAELIAASINSQRLKNFSPFQNGRYMCKQKPSKEESFHKSSEGSADEDV